MRKFSVRLSNFIKRNALYLILILCVMAVGLSATFMVLNNIQSDDLTVDAPLDDVVGETQKPSVIYFIMPVENPVSVDSYAYTMVWNETMNRYTAHVGIDYFADEGTPVKAVYDGIVESVETDLIKGVTVTIDHGNGLKTIYNSLQDADFIPVGKSVKTGDTIGHVSVSNRTEYKRGAHLHFEVSENGETIDPEKYFQEENK
ncbi:MAG: M23 family metallopeptidase [Clostridia bacterium]|nr:M23 family metallopeptidase [Clostridia bacterium]